jgi:hypothetical protein
MESIGLLLPLLHESFWAYRGGYEMIGNMRNVLAIRSAKIFGLLTTVGDVRDLWICQLTTSAYYGRDYD